MKCATETHLIKLEVMPIWTRIVGIGLGCMFVYSGLPKLRHPYEFLCSVYDYELVGPQLGMLAAMALPWLELLVGVCLIGGICVGGALLASAGLGVLFTVVLASALHRGLKISCGCFSTSRADALDYSTLIRAGLILVLSVTAYLCLVLHSRARRGRGMQRSDLSPQVTRFLSQEV